MTRRVAVLTGGWSSERSVSLASGRECAKALRDLGFDVSVVDVTRDLDALVAALGQPRPDVVFNALHGRGGEDGTVQGVLEFLKLPYTHSGVRASAVAMDKPLARDVFARAGLPIAEGHLVTRSDLAAGVLPLPAPFVLKPADEGSSVGVRIVRAGDNALAAEMAAWPHGERILVERFVPGRELTVAVMGSRALGVCEILTGADFYDFDAKYAVGGSQHIVPAAIHPEAAARALDVSVRAHAALGCRGVSRADLRYDDTAGEPGEVILLEVNTQPGMTPTSLVPDIARAAGLTFHDLVHWMVENAACDT